VRGPAPHHGGAPQRGAPAGCPWVWEAASGSPPPPIPKAGFLGFSLRPVEGAVLGGVCMGGLEQKPWLFQLGLYM